MAGARGAKWLLSAYSGEHGIYGVVLVTALIGAEIEAPTDLDVIWFVAGTVGVFWLAHIYAAVVASRSRRPVPPLHVGIRDGVRHSGGMALAMLIPVFLLAADDQSVDAVVALSQIMHGQRQQPQRTFAQAVVIGLVELVLHYRNRDGGGAHPQQGHAGAQAERQPQRD